MSKLLLVEDEADLRFSLTHNLEFEGFEVDAAETGPQGLEKALQGNYDLIILDIMLPDMDGLAVLKHIREHDESIPVMMLTAKSTEMDKVLGFRLGADDYLTKPFGLGEFLARVQALLRRNRVEQKSGSRKISFLDIVVDFDNYTIAKGGEEIHFSQKEFQLLKYLLQRPNQALDKAEILDAVWDYSSNATSRTIDTHVARIRRKLGDTDHAIIKTVPTVGYKFAAELNS